jgi:hypothetical protein
MANDGTGTNWDENDPLGNLPARDGQVQLRDLRKGVRQRSEKEHVTFAGAGAGGEHKAGSAKVYRQTAAPTLRPDGATALDASDEGRIWIDDTGLLKYRKSDNTWAGIFSTSVIDDSVTWAKLNSVLQNGLRTEMYGPADAVPWNLKPGSAHIYAGNYDAGFPTKRPDGTTNLNDSDIGRLALNWNVGNLLKYYAGAANGWQDIKVGAIADAIVGLAKLDATVQGLLGIRVATGTYSGNNSTNKPVTGLGFQPDIIVIIDQQTAAISWGHRQLGSSRLFIAGATVTAAGTFDFVADGFAVKTTDAHVNTLNRTYGYLAIRSNT